jgi:hypothetical protein
MKKYGSRPGLKKIDTGVRPVAPTFGVAAFITHVSKGGGVLVFENIAERLVAQLLGLDPRVRSFRRQPFTVDLVECKLLRTAEERNLARRRYAGRPGPSLYTPDFGVEFVDTQLRAIEVKLRGFAGSDDDHERMDQAAVVLKSYGQAFHRVVLSDDLRHPIRANTGLMHQASLRQGLGPSSEVVHQVDCLARAGASTVADFVRGLGISVDHVPHLLIHGILSMDTAAHRIEGKSPASPAYGCLQHLELMERLVA